MSAIRTSPVRRRLRSGPRRVEPSPTTTNRYLQGPFAPVHREVTLTDLAVTGELPPHLDGRYLRNGPNPAAPVDAERYHWFMGKGMVHGLRIRDGRAEWYRNRWVRSAMVSRALGEPVTPRRTHAGFDFAANTNVIGHGGRILAIAEGGGLPYELTNDLGTVGPCNLGETRLRGYSAHPHRHPVTGDLHAVSYYWGRPGVLQYSVIDPSGRLQTVFDVAVDGSPMVHDFALTARHAVILDLPVALDPRLAISSLPSPLQHALMPIAGHLVGRAPVPGPLARIVSRLQDGVTLPYSWDPDRPARLGVFSLGSAASDLRWFEIDPCFVFHVLNAHEDHERLVIDVVRHPVMFATDTHGPLADSAAMPAPTLDRWTIDTAAGVVNETRLSDHPLEFPRLDERRAGLAHRYGYASGFQPDVGGRLDMPTQVLKFDLHAGTQRIHSLGPDRSGGEFCFIATPGSDCEDDGVLMGFVHDAATDRGELLVLDAETLEQVARVHLPVRVPHGFHGNWLPA